MKKILFIALLLTLISTAPVYADSKNQKNTNIPSQNETLNEEKPSKKMNNMVIIAVPLFLVSGSLLLIKNN